MLEYFIAFIYYLGIFVISIPILLWLYKELTMGICNCRDSMDNKVVVITGGNNGIGFETSVELAKRGAKIIIGCRKIQNVADKIQSLVPDSNVEVMKLDLASNDSIRHFATEVKSRTNVIDVLINNAGMVTNERKQTKDGYDLTMATNYLGHFLLNHLLLDLVKHAGDVNSGFSRIILVSSIASFGKREVLDLCQYEEGKHYKINFNVNESAKNALLQYGKSKRAQVMYGKHLSKVLENEKCNVLVASLHPGLVRTDIFHGLPADRQRNFQRIGYILGKNCRQGAQTTIHLAVSQFSGGFQEINGNFFSDCRHKNWFDFSKPKIMDDPVACQKLWEETIKLLKIKL